MPSCGRLAQQQQQHQKANVARTTSDGGAFSVEVASALRRQVEHVEELSRQLRISPKRSFRAVDPSEECISTERSREKMQKCRTLVAQSIRRLYISASRGASSGTLLGTVEQLGSELTLLQSYLQSVMRSGGATLQKELRAAALAAFRSLNELLSTMAELGRDQELQINPCSAAIAQFDAFEAVSVDDVTAVCKRMRHLVASVADAVEEIAAFEELDISDDLELLHVDAVRDDGGDDDDDDDATFDDWCSEAPRLRRCEFVLVPPSLRLARRCSSVLRTLSAFLRRRYDASGDDNAIPWLEALLQVSRHIADKVDRLVASLHPPHDKADVELSVRSLHLHVGALLDLTCSSELWNDAEFRSGGKNTERSMGGREWRDVVHRSLHKCVNELLDLLRDGDRN